MRIFPVILAGGEGRRLAPLSTPARPKAFVPLPSGRTMLEETCARLETGPYEKPVLVLNRLHAELAETSGLAVLTEAQAGGTAMAVALSALYVQNVDPDAVMLVCACDHWMEETKKFHAAVAAGSEFAQSYHVLFGVTPSRPDTGLGYIHKGEVLTSLVSRVTAFKEKPDFETAKSYVETGYYFWNAGIFIFSPKLILRDIERHAPGIYEAALQSWRGRSKVQEGRIDAGPWTAQHDRSSIDCAVLEKVDHKAVVKLETGWRDLGTPESLAALS